MANIRKVDRPKPWVVEWRTVDGQKRSATFARKVDAEAKRADVEVARFRGELVDPLLGRIPFGEWSERWLEIAGADLKPKTLASYRSLLDSRIVPMFGDMPIATIRAEDVDGWVAGMRGDGLSPSRIRQAHVVLSAALELAVRHRRIARNVARGAELPAIRRREAPHFYPADVDRIVDEVDSSYRMFIAVQGVLGLRFGEAAALRRRSVDPLRRRLTVDRSLAEVSGALIFGATKTHAAREVPLPPTLQGELIEHLDTIEPDPDALLFTSTTGRPIRYSRFRPMTWVPALDRLGLPRYGMHALRHSAAARMIGAGWQAKAMQQILGHSSVAFTLTVYGHLFDDDLDDLATALESTSRRTGAVQQLEDYSTRPGDSGL